MEENQVYEEIKQVIEHLKNYFSCEGLRNNFSVDNYLAKDKDDILNSHEYLLEIERYIRDGHELNIPSLLDMDPLFTSLEKGSLLSAIELSSISDLLSTAQLLYDELYDKKEYYHLNDDALDLNPVIQLKRDLANCIDVDMTISDNASPKLRELRNERKTIQKRLSNIMDSYRQRYSKYLSDDVIALKNGEESLPIKSSFKGEVRGTVVAYSSSGETAFMVPYEVVDLRNSLNTLLSQENSEVLRILADLSSKCTKQLKYLKRDYQIISTFDRYSAAVRYGHDYFGCVASLSEDYLSLKGFFHPLLKAKENIKNNLTLGKEEPKTLLISGPNAGGKSILIKAVALSVLMDKLGLLVPCVTEAYIPFINDIYYLGGDNQSVMDNLSTFSSHLLGIKNITDKAKSDSLVIIDEVGEGTSPRDGEAIGVSLLKYFVNLNCFTLLTSHFDGMKSYAVNDEKILTAAMEFNNNTLKPTYHLLLHSSGKSYGILLARQMGLKKEIVDEAITYQNSKAKDSDALLERLNEQISINEKKQRDLDNKIKDYERLCEKKDKAILALNEEKNSIKQKAEKKIERIVDEKVAEINSLWENKGKSMNYSQISQAKGELKKIQNKPTNQLQTYEKNQVLTDLKKGEIVTDEDSHKATVLEVKKKEVILDYDGLRITRKIEGLKRYKLTASDIKKKNDKNIVNDFAYLDVAPSRGIELNIIGLHVDEAMRSVVSFLDSARLRKLTYVRIIHGTGTFALKNALWKYLANHKEFVKDYEFGGERDGGLGATIIHLK